MRAALCLTALLVALASPAAAEPAGKIRVCRTPGVIGAADRSRVLIPKGTGFTSGYNPKTGDELKPTFTLHTTSDAALPPKPGCVTVPAVLDDNPAGFRLTAKYGPLPSQLSVPGLDLTTRVAEDFR